MNPTNTDTLLHRYYSLVTSSLGMSAVHLIKSLKVAIAEETQFLLNSVALPSGLDSMMRSTLAQLEGVGWR